MSMGWLLETGTAAGSAAKRYHGEVSGGGGKGCVAQPCVGAMWGMGSSTRRVVSLVCDEEGDDKDEGCVN